jgi:hypothetical protein
MKAHQEYEGKGSLDPRTLEKIDRLTEVLKRLNQGEDPYLLKREMKDFLTSINPAVLSIAEQKILEAGLPAESLRHLCTTHMEILADELQKTKSGLKPGHVIHTMMAEHEKILGFLDELEHLNQKVWKMPDYSSEKGEVKLLLHIASHLIDAEPHHKREEEVIFPRLESKGLSGPPHIMRLEHEELRKWKKDLKNIADNAAQLEFDAFKKRLKLAAEFLTLKLRDHIYKENNILYPTALEMISEEEWIEMKIDCDKIGYCCFTPEE